MKLNCLYVLNVDLLCVIKFSDADKSKTSDTDEEYTMVTKQELPGRELFNNACINFF